MLRMKLIVLFFVVLLCASSATAQQAVVIDINNADVATLVKHVKGIGAKKAEAIVQYREANGSFKSVDDLAKVKGIGEKTIEANRAILSINN